MRACLIFGANVVVSLCFAAGCGGDVEGTAGGGGSGGQGGGGSGGGQGGEGVEVTVDGAPECGATETQITGTALGEGVTVALPAGGMALSGGVQITFGAYGALFLTSSDGVDLGVVHPVTGFLRMPEDSPKPGEWYCAGPGSGLLLDDDLTTSRLVLRSVSALGPCPGEPVEGSIEVCFQGPDCVQGVSSTVPGATFTVPLEGLAGASGPTGGTEMEASATLAGTGGFVTLQATEIDVASSGVQASALGIGYVTIPSGQPDAGAVYCIGAGSTLDYVMDGPFPTPVSASLHGLSRLGSCPGTPVAGEIGLCMNQNE